MWSVRQQDYVSYSSLYWFHLYQPSGLKPNNENVVGLGKRLIPISKGRDNVPLLPNRHHIKRPKEKKQKRLSMNVGNGRT